MIWLIIPACNEEEALVSVLSRLPEHVDGCQVNPLVVSDGSTDGTVGMAVAGGVPVLAISENRGKGSAVQAALDSIPVVPADIVVVMDADGQHQPEDLPRLVKPILEGDRDVVLASRYIVDGGRSNTPWNRYLVRTATVAILHRLLGRRFSDPYCGFRAFSGAVMADIRICGQRYEGELESLFDACRTGLRVVEVPIERIYGPATSKMALDGGRLIGRLRAVRQYARTLTKKRLEMHNTAAPERVREWL